MKYDIDVARETAEAARRQIGVGGFMTLGASDLCLVREDEMGLAFNARIHPFTKSGKRAGQARVMRVTVTINANDYWDVKVQRADGAMHFITEDVPGDELQRLMLALDYDGPEVVNPRYWTA